MLYWCYGILITFCREENKISASKPEKIDHRKTTWMNGFMMFSRYNRKKFIE